MLAEIKGSLKLLQLGLSEAVWQTRCVICDVPGVALCDKCSRELPYLDQLSACPPMRSALGARDMLRMQSTNLALEGIATLSPRWLRFCGIAFTGNKAHRNRFQRSRRTAAFRDNCPPYGKYSSALLASRSCARPHTRAHQRRPRARVRSHFAYRS